MTLAAGRPAAALETDPVVVDESAALSIGNFEISRYLLDKNYNQFAAAHHTKLGQQPSRDEIASWFRLFIARLAIKARLVEEGYLDRPEVRREVNRMERQILTQIDGPLYESLHPPDALTPERLRTLHEASARVFDAWAVRFDDATTATALLGKVASPDDFESAVKKLASSGQVAKFDLHIGPSAWPHGSFQEIADVFPTAPHGTVLGPLPRALGVYFLLVRGESSRPVPDLETTRTQWEKYVRHQSRTLIQRVRRWQIIREREFLPDDASIAQLMTQLRPVSGQPHTIAEAASLDGPEKVLASYATLEGRRSITDRAFVHHFNQRIIRSMPRDPASLVAAIEDIVVEEYDYAAAIAGRLDREPKFVQDRRNFVLNQALTLYENEVLAPQVTISPAELQAYYSTHSERYAVTDEATGVLYQFASQATAVESLQRLNRGENVAHAEQVLDPLVVRRDGPPLVIGRPNAILLTMPDGRAFGPFEREGKPAVFLKRASGPKKAPPLTAMEGLIRQELMRDKLDALESQLFEERSARHTLRVHFDFSKYGIGNPFADESTTPTARSAGETSISPSSATPRSG